ncbi:MAG: O-antigen ligase family protein [Candidatus Hydrogenedentota bacterium]
MSKKKGKKTGSQRERANTPAPGHHSAARAPGAAPVALRRWDADLPAPRTVYLALGAIVAAIVIIAGVWSAKTSGLGGSMLASVHPETLVIMGAGVFAFGATALHPGFGIAALCLLRPWFDGLTYRADNLYFLAIALFLIVLWALRLLRRGGTPGQLTPVLLLGGYVLAGLGTAPFSVDLSVTYFRLLLWGGFLGLFLVCSGGLHSRAATMLALGGLVAAAFYEAAYALLHFEFVLDYVRREMIGNPEILRAYFGVDKATPEILRRLNVNRAFGTMLHPNTLAALLILALPLVLGGFVYCVQRNQEALRARAARVSGPQPAGTAPAWLTFLGVLCTVLLATAIYATLAETPMPFTMILGVAFVLALVLAVILGGTVAAYSRKNGGFAARYAAGGFAFLVCLPVLAYALWLSYSRGAMLSLAIALFLVILLLAARRFTPAAGRYAAGLVILVVAGAAMLGAAQNPAGDAAGEGNTAALGTERMPLSARELLEEGEDLDIKQLMDPSSFRLRLSYWKVGWRMVQDRPLTGVGLGNFGAAYQRYQTMDAGDVEAAHNGYLKALAETGLFGFLLFTGFWAYVVLWGAWRIHRENDRAERYLLAGIYGGILAFLGHSFLDFNFYNPSLVTFVIVLTGVFFARARVTADTMTNQGARTRVAVQGMALVLLVVAAFLAGMGYRIYTQHYALNGTRLNLDAMERLHRNAELANVLIPQVGNFGVQLREARNEGDRITMSPPKLPLEALRPFLRPVLAEGGGLDEERTILEQYGSFYLPTSDGGWRRIADDAPLEPNVWFVVNREPLTFLILTRRALAIWLDEVESIDRLYPYRADLAVYLAKHYEMLRAHTGPRATAQRRALLEACVRWAEAAVERSPLDPNAHRLLADTLWMRAKQTNEAQRRRDSERGLREYRLAQRCASETSPELNFALAGALESYGKMLIEAGAPDRGHRLINEAETYREKAQRIIKVRGSLGLYNPAPQGTMQRSEPQTQAGNPL